MAVWDFGSRRGLAAGLLVALGVPGAAAAEHRTAPADTTQIALGAPLAGYRRDRDLGQAPPDRLHTAPAPSNRPRPPSRARTGLRAPMGAATVGHNRRR